jgi:tRNA modification GTPase
MYHDTIAAIATPAGQGGLGILRLSGPEAWSIAARLCGVRLEDHRIVHGHLRDPQTGAVVDEVLLSPMAAPRTYTREDVVEISCHGSPLVLQRALGLALRCGARLANPGEFTLRAFLNGRIDLAQAESVLDVIQAQTDAGLRLAIEGLRGRLSKPIRDARHKVLQVQAYLTACIDFPEDEVERQTDLDPARALGEAAAEVRRLIDSAEAGMVYRHGVRTAIVGRPNVGKSSLLNRLLGEDRAIVTPVPGTTRDTIEEVANVRGIPFHLIDTAGLRQSPDPVEHLGIERSRRAIGQADLLLLVVDASVPLTGEDREVLALGAGRPHVTVANKSDLPAAVAAGELPSPVARLSALTGQGMDALREAMERAALGGKASASDAVLVTNPRHKAALERALEHLEAARESLGNAMPADFVTIDLASCLGALGEITGEDASEELLDTIFRQFCIGK